MYEVNSLVDTSDENFARIAAAVEENENDPRPLDALGLVFHYRAQYKEAVNCYSRALELTKNFPLDSYMITEETEGSKKLAPMVNYISEIWFNMGVSYQYMGDILNAANAFAQAIHISGTDRVISEHYRAMINLAALHHSHGDINVAIEYYTMAANSVKSIENKEPVPGPIINDIQTTYLPVPAHHGSYAMIYANLAVAYIQKFLMVEAEAVIKELHVFLNDMLEKFQCEVDSSIQFILRDIRANFTHSNRDSSLSNIVECKSVRESIIQTFSHLMNSQRRYSSWSRVESGWNLILRESIKQISARSEIHPKSSVVLNPFDSLLLPYIHGRDSLAVARHASAVIQSNIISPFCSLLIGCPCAMVGVFDLGPEYLCDPHVWREEPKVTLGFMSYDFNGHPTAHLVEAIFVELFRYRLRRNDSRCGIGKSSLDDVNLNVYSYGKDDNSSYRRNIERLSDKFVDLSLLSFEDSAKVILNDRVDILLDMQLHTLGHRLQITAHRPALIQVNYLVYPGTAGGSIENFLSHIIADRVVIPVESQSRFYSEKMLLLPPTYQVSFDGRVNLDDVMNDAGNALCRKTELVNPFIQSKDRAVSYAHWKQSRSVLRRVYLNDADGNAIVFCNFNKIDKFDPITFQIWMQILKRTPNSYLWLLNPGDAKPLLKNGTSTAEVLEDAQQNILTRKMIESVALMFGVMPSRIVYCNRTDKNSHIVRHTAADIFLDTVVYGAHSTATDALRGNLPVITVASDMFPSRVGASLYASLTNGQNPPDMKSIEQLLENLMVMDTVKSMEEMSVRLTRNPRSRNRDHDNAHTAISTLSYLSAESLYNHSYITELRDASAGMVEYKSSGFLNSKASVKNLVLGLQSLFESRLVSVSLQKYPHRYTNSKITSEFGTGYHVVVT